MRCLTSSPVENVVAAEVRTHSKAGNIMIALQHILVGISRVQENPGSSEEQHRRRQLVIPAQHTQIGDHVKGLGIAGQPWICGQAEVGVVAGGVEQPRRPPHVLVEVVGGVVERLDEGVPFREPCSPPFVAGEPEHRLCPPTQLF